MTAPRSTEPSAARKLCECVHLVALAVWFGAVAMAAVVAARVFPVMRELDPTLGAYPDYAGDHALLAGGRVAGGIFLIADVVQFACGFVVLATTIALVGWLGWQLRRWSTGLRMFAIGAALLAVSYHLMVLAPRMQQNLSAYWDLAKAGETERAGEYRDAFLAEHPTASRTLGAIGVSVFLALSFGIWSAQGASRPEPSPGELPS